MKTKNQNATHLADAIKNSNVVNQIAKNGNLYFKDVTFSQDGYPRSVGVYRALVGFKDQQDAEMWAKLTDGEFSMFFQKDGWQLLSYKGRARLTDIYTLAGSYPVYYLDGNENHYDLCEKIHGISLIDYLRDSLDIDEDDVPESWIKTAIECCVKKTSQYPEGISEDEEAYYDEIEDKVRESLRYIENFKGYRNYVVIDDINWVVEGEYDSEYPAHYHEANDNYIFGVLYPQDREEEIREII